MKKFVFVFSLILLLFLLSPLAEARLGGAGAQFLAIGSGSRPLALGGAYVALAEGVDAIYWNPAGLATEEYMAFSFSHTHLFAGLLKRENVAFIHPGLGGVIGVSAIAFLSGDIDITTVEEPEGTGDTYTANDFAAGISYARMMTDKFAAGFTLKLISQNIYKCSAFGWAFDLGGIYNTGLRNLRLGFVIQNFGPDLRYGGELLEFSTSTTELMNEDVSAQYKSSPYSLPLSFQVGVAYDLFSSGSNRITALFDGVHPIDQDETFAAGLEYWLSEAYSIRLGYTDRNNNGLSFGLGAKIPLGNEVKALVDYGYVRHDYLDATQHFTISFSY